MSLEFRNGMKSVLLGLWGVGGEVAAVRHTALTRVMFRVLTGDFDASELSDGEQSQVCCSIKPLQTTETNNQTDDKADVRHIQDWLGPDPQDMKALMDKLLQENQEISQLESQLQVSTESRWGQSSLKRS